MPSFIDVVTILVDDMARAKEFYTELLGFQVVDQFTAPDEEFIWLRSEKRSASIALQDASKRAEKPTQADIPQASGGLMLGFVVDDADKAYAEWQSRGVELRTEVVDMGKGRTFGAKDPDGNCIQVFDVYPKFQEIQRKLGLD